MNEEKNPKVKTLTRGALKRSSEKAILDFRKDISFSECPKCGLRTYVKEHDMCINCDDEDEEV